MNDSNDTQPSAAYWEQQVQAWKLSGLSQAGFCKTNDLVYHQFIYWRAKFDGVASGSRALKKNHVGFARVKVQPSVVNELTLSLPNGFVFRGLNTENISVVRELLDHL